MRRGLTIIEEHSRIKVIFQDLTLFPLVCPDRMRARSLDPEGLKGYYRQRNLLKAEILADHVGNGVVFLPWIRLPPPEPPLSIDGGIMAAFPR